MAGLSALPAPYAITGAGQGLDERAAKRPEGATMADLTNELKASQ